MQVITVTIAIVVSPYREYVRNRVDQLEDEVKRNDLLPDISLSVGRGHHVTSFDGSDQ